MTNEDLFVINPDYSFKHDVKRSIIISNSFIQCDQSNTEWFSIIHPIQAMIFSFFSNPVTIKHAVDDLSDFLNLSNEEVQNIINPFIENPEPILTQYDGQSFSFPKKNSHTISRTVNN